MGVAALLLMVAMLPFALGKLPPEPSEAAEVKARRKGLAGGWPG